MSALHARKRAQECPIPTQASGDTCLACLAAHRHKCWFIMSTSQDTQHTKLSNKQKIKTEINPCLSPVLRGFWKHLKNKILYKEQYPSIPSLLTKL